MTSQRKNKKLQRQNKYYSAKIGTTIHKWKPQHINRNYNAKMNLPQRKNQTKVNSSGTGGSALLFYLFALLFHLLCCCFYYCVVISILVLQRYNKYVLSLVGHILKIYLILQFGNANSNTFLIQMNPTE